MNNDKVVDLILDNSEVKKMKPNPEALLECFPISSLDGITELLENPPEWVNLIAELKERSSTVVQNTIGDCHCEDTKFGLQPRTDRRFVPKTLVCHDYKGGYLEDKFLSGIKKGDLYSFYHWAHIDIFVYFSHHLITIPPIGWINAAHNQGVKILGTFITEFGPGSKVCQKIFHDEDTMRIFATSLTKIAKIFRFDGWLLNIENPLADTEMLGKFVEYLTVSTHKDNPENLVIWYDSVIKTGELKWQNELNKDNRMFFDICDGIFLNYVWTEEKIQKTVELAKHRTLDVYVGVDVFGRNTFGGGEFNCYKAAQVIRRHHLSMAIFAPGWTHETLPANLQTFDNFINRDASFWNSLWPYLYTHPIKQCFNTNFFTGVDKDNFDLFSQQQQLSKIKHPTSFALVPNYTEILTLSNKCNCLQCAFTDNTLGCLITKQFLNSSLSYVHKLFLCDLALEGTITLYFLSQMSVNNIAELSISLLVMDQNNSVRVIKCNSEKTEELRNDSTMVEVNPATDIALINQVNRMYDDLIALNDLELTIFQFDVPCCTLLEIGCTLERGEWTKLFAFGITNDDLLA